jgi:hypothetical protein
MPIILLLFVLTLFLGCLLLAIFFAVTAKTPAGRVASILAGVFILFVVPIGLMALLMVARTVESATATVVTDQSSSVLRTGPPLQSQLNSTQPIHVAPPVPPSVTITPEISGRPKTRRSESVWRTSNIDDTFQANVYPSYEAAVAALIKRLKESLVKNQVFRSDEDGRPIVPANIVVSGSEVGTRVPGLVGLVHSEFPESEVSDGGDVPGKPEADTLSVHFTVSDVLALAAPWQIESLAEHAVLACKGNLGGNSTSVDCRVTEKPWVETFDRFVSMYPLRNFAVGYSLDFHSSEGDARRSALDDAKRQASIDINGREVRYIDERHVVDRFAQQLSRPYGTVWREALLVELPGAPEVARTRVKVQESFRSWAILRLGKRFGILVFLISAGFLCLALNWVTMGYYRAPVVLGLTGLAALCLLIAVLITT